MATPVTRTEIADLIEDHLDGTPQHRNDLVAAATAAGARPPVISTLERLPNSTYITLRDLWPHLSDIAIEN